MVSPLSQARAFAAVLDDRIRVLILGSVPGRASLQAQQYYAHPRNAFWPLMQQLFGIDRELPYTQRLHSLLDSGVGLWDVVAVCQREGSLDSAIRTSGLRLNPFSSLWTGLPELRAICFNGKKAEALFKQAVRRGEFDLPETIVLHGLPSTSPALASLSIEQKCQHWQLIKRYSLLTVQAEAVDE